MCTFEERVIVPGRCLSVALCLNSFGLRKRLHILNLHNYGFSGAQVAAVGVALDKCFADSVSKPKEEFGVLIGDYNFIAKDDRVFQVGSPPIAGASISAVYCSGSRQGQWMKHLASWTEVVQPFPTH